MQDDPKTTSGSPAGVGQDSTPSWYDPQVQQMTDEEYQQRFREQSDAAQDEVQADPTHPVRGFWQRLLHGAQGHEGFVGRATEAGRSLLRGAVDLTQGLAKTEQAFGGKLQESDNPFVAAAGTAFQKAGQALHIEDASKDALLGKRSDDPIASFAEGATQFGLGFAATGGVGALAEGGVAALGGSRLLQLTAAGASRGALVDFAGMDPDEEGLAELLAKAPIRGVNDLGQLLSVKDGDGEIIKRLKRAGAGMIPGVAIEAIGAKLAIRSALKTIADPEATAAAREAAKETLGNSVKTLDDIAAGTHVPEGAHVTVARTEEGLWEVRPVNPAAVDEAMPRGQMAAETKGMGITREVDPNADALDIVHGGEEGLGEPLAPQRLQYADRGEAEAQAETINRGLNDRIGAARQAQGGLSAEQGQQIREWADRLTKTTDPEELQRLVDGTHFNLAYYTQRPQHIKALIESVSEVMKASIDETGGVAKVAVAESFRRARALIHGQPLGEMAPAVTEMLEHPDGITNRHALALAADLVMRDFGETIGRMWEVLEARPHDVVAHEEAALALNNYFNLQRTLAAHNSEAGRTLNILKYRDLFDQWAGKLTGRAAKRAEKDGAKAGEEAAAEAATKKPIPQPAQQKAKEIHPLRKAKPDVDADGVEKAAEGEGLGGADFGLAEGDNRINLDEVTGHEPPEVKVKHGGREDPVKSAPEPEPQFTAGMKHREIRTTVRMFQMAQGKPRLYFDAARATRIIQETGMMKQGIEYFVNSLLSGFITPTLQLTSGVGVAQAEVLAKALAGVGKYVRTGDAALIREAGDQWYSYFHYFRENLSGATQAFREGRSILNPSEQHYAIGGLTGKIVRTPSRAIMATDEFTRVAAYRAEVRAKSLRWWREKGMTGVPLQVAVEKDVRAAFDSKTGIATLPEALKKAELPTLSGALRTGTVGRALLQATNEAPILKFIAPFIKASSNIFDYAWQATPGLNRLNSAARATMEQGGEEAAILHARSALASTVYLSAVMLASGGMLTGSGPADPKMRREWLKNHKPRTLTIGGESFDYTRVEPVATFLGLVADAHDLIKYGDEAGGTDLGTAVMAALMHNFVNKPYMEGIANWTEAASSQDPRKTHKFLSAFAAAVIPRFVQQFNGDEHFREVKGYAEELKAKLPIFSQSVPMRYDAYGEPIMRTPNGPLMLNRLINPVKYQGEKPSSIVAQHIEDLRQGFGPAPRFLIGGSIDLADAQQFGRNAEGQTPWDRFNEVVREGKHGEGGIDARLRKVIESGKWDKLSAGDPTMAPGGTRWIRAQAEMEGMRKKALAAVLHEFRKLDTAYVAMNRAKGAALEGGEVEAVRVLQGYHPANQ